MVLHQFKCDFIYTNSVNFILWVVYAILNSWQGVLVAETLLSTIALIAGFLFSFNFTKEVI